MTLAELAIGLAGFSGVVAAFSYRGELEAIDRIRFVALFSIAISTAIFAFVPFAFFYTGFQEPSIWRYSSALFLIWAVALGTAIGPRLRSTALSTGARIPRPMVVFVFGLTLVNLVLQLLNATGSFFEPGPLAYIAGLLIWIAFSALFFSFLVLFRPKPPAG